MPQGIKPLPESLLTQIYVAVLRHQATVAFPNGYQNIQHMYSLNLVGGTRIAYPFIIICAKENIKRGKCFHLTTSSCIVENMIPSSSIIETVVDIIMTVLGTRFSIQFSRIILLTSEWLILIFCSQKLDYWWPNSVRDKISVYTNMKKSDFHIHAVAYCRILSVNYDINGLFY